MINDPEIQDFHNFKGNEENFFNDPLEIDNENADFDNNNENEIFVTDNLEIKGMYDKLPQIVHTVAYPST